jgi:PAS domain S-box-containing protein
MTHDLRVSHNKLKDYSVNLENKVRARTLSLTEEKKKLKKINNKLTESEQKFRSYIDKAPDGIFVINKNGAFIEANNSSLLFIGCSEEDLKKIKFFDIICDKDVPQIKKHLETVLKLGQAEDDVLYKRRGDNVEGDSCGRYFNVSSVKLSGDLILVFVKDITKEKEVDKAKTEFVSLASHQLRTPLSAINWYSEMLLAGDGGKLTKDQRKFSEEISASNKRMVELVNSLLNVSRLEMGTFIIDPEPTNVVEIMESVIKEQIPMIVSKKIEVKKKISSDIPIINSDPKLLRIVFQNLVSNAVKYTSENKSLYVEISLDKKKKSIYIKVQDEGYGIQKNQQDRIFSKLFRADNVKKKNTEGTGLGLYIVKAIVAHAGGNIWFESEENKGTIFHLMLPLKGMKAKKGDRSLS